MKIILAIFGFVITAEAGHRITSASTTFQSRIINGVEVKSGETPYQVSLQWRDNDNRHFCSGVIINEKYVLTAATCIVGKVGAKIRVICGTTDLNITTCLHNVRKVFVHDDFDNAVNPTIFNIGLVEIENTFDTSTTVKPVKLPPKNSTVPEKAYVFGWGQTSKDSGNTKVLHKTEVTVVKRGTCQTAWNDLLVKIDKTHICGYNTKDKSGPCTGDDGGPLMSDEMLIGIVVRPARISECGSSKYPALYTKISEYLKWIDEYSKI